MPETHFSADQHATLNALAETFQALSFIGSCAVVGSYMLFPRLRKVSSKSRRLPTHRLVASTAARFTDQTDGPRALQHPPC